MYNIYVKFNYTFLKKINTISVNIITCTDVCIVFTFAEPTQIYRFLRTRNMISVSRLDKFVCFLICKKFHCFCSQSS